MSAAIAALSDRIEDALAAQLPTATGALSPRLLQAMRYSTLAGGKRIRPLLVLAANESVGGELAHALTPACALEYIHTYSLIHDDLPAMDNDVLRRGKPTCHIAFDEATAILAGCGLLTHALALLATSPGLEPQTRLAMLSCVTGAAGSAGMLAGQSVDLASTGNALALAAVETMHAAKTGALIRAAVQVGAMSGGCTDPDQLAALDRFAAHLGLGFQVGDDLLNVTGDSARLGKAVGSDADLGKNSYAALLGVDAAKARLAQLHDQAMEALQPLGPAADLLRGIARTLRDRDH